MCPSKTKPTSRLIAATVAGAATRRHARRLLRSLYRSARQDQLSAGDAMAANQVMQMNDPWPAHSGNTNIAFNGQRMQSAVERYRTNNALAAGRPRHNFEPARPRP